MSKDDDQVLAEDLMEGADEIAEFLFGDRSKRRKVYHLASDAKSGQKLPVFRLGATICARRSTLKRWIAAQERGAQSNANEE